MRRVCLAAAGTAAFVMLAGASGCSSGGGSSSSSSATSSVTPSGYDTAAAAAASASPSPTAKAKVKTASAGKLGTILVDGKGRTLYLFEKDKSKTSTCKGACAAAWPPLLTAGKPAADGSAKSNLLGTSKRSDHTQQVTYHGHPLYRYAGDSKAGDTKGQGLDQFGAEWYVLDTKGNKVDRD